MSRFMWVHHVHVHVSVIVLNEKVEGSMNNHRAQRKPKGRWGCPLFAAAVRLKHGADVGDRREVTQLAA